MTLPISPPPEQEEFNDDIQHIDYREEIEPQPFHDNLGPSRLNQ